MDNLRVYFQDVWEELLYRVTWPTWSELQSSTIVVMIASLMIALTVFLMDFTLGANPENPIFKGMLHYIYQIFASLRS